MGTCHISDGLGTLILPCCGLIELNTETLCVSAFKRNTYF